MKKPLMMIACLVCFFLNTSMAEVSSMGTTKFFTPQFKEESRVEIQGTPTPTLAGWFKLPKGGIPKGGSPKGKAPKVNEPKGGHDKNVRESNREKHENADGRRQREPAKAEEKREKNK